MARYYNIFTQVQLQTAPEMGVPLPPGDEERYRLTGYNYWAGKIGQAQIGPIYLGWLGLASLLFGFFGVTAAFLLLPKTVKYVIRRFVTGIIGEIVAVVITGLLTEKLVDLVGRALECVQAIGVENS